MLRLPSTNVLSICSLFLGKKIVIPCSVETDRAVIYTIGFKLVYISVKS